MHWKVDRGRWPDTAPKLEKGIASMARHASYKFTGGIQDGIDFLSKSHQNMYAGLVETIANLDKYSEESLHHAVALLILAHIEQKELSDHLRVSRTTINRWAHGQNIPREPAFRAWLITRLLDILQQKRSADLDPGLSLNSSKQPQASSQKPSRPKSSKSLSRRFEPVPH